MGNEFSVQGNEADVRIKQDGGKVKVETEFDSFADAQAAADDLANKKRAGLKGLDKVINFDRHISPKTRETGEIFLRLVGVIALVVLGFVVASNAGDAAILLLPSSPIPDWLLWLFGALTVPAGIWAAHELIKTIRDDIPDEEQKVRKFGLIAIVALCLTMDLVGVVTSRVAYSTGSMEEMEQARADAQAIRAKLKKAEMELVLLETPAIPSLALKAKMDAMKGEPTRTGKPVASVGELYLVCQGYKLTERPNYCHEYQARFSKIHYVESEYQGALALERAKPRLEGEIADYKAELAQLNTTGAGLVDEFFVSEKDPALRAAQVRAIRFWRTIGISIAQVALLAIIALLLLDDQHDRMVKRQKAKLEGGVNA